MKKLKKILIICLWCGLVAGLLATMSFVNKEQEALTCKSLDIKINQDDDVYFLNKMDIVQLMKDRGGSIIGQPKSAVNVTSIENALNSHEDIAKSEVYMTIDGVVNVKVKQRKPIVRVINSNDNSYYMDDDGKLMPLSDKYTARVLIVNGNIWEPYSTHYMYSVEDLAKDGTLGANSMLDDVFAMAKYINKDEFWKAQIQQIYINKDKDMELVPLAGNQKIIFGDTTAMDEKFKKLMTFYTQALNTTGWWDKYSIINLKFKNQIVCTKK